MSAGLLLTSLTRLTATDTGFDRRYLLTFRAVSHLHEMPRQATFIDGVLERVGALPGVESVAMTDRLPFETTPATGIGTSIRLIGRDDSEEEPPRVLGDTVSPGYLATLGLRLEAGRDLTARDGVDAPPVVIVNRAFTRRFFPGEPDARTLDRRQLEMPVRSFNREAVSIAGIVADARTSASRTSRRRTSSSPMRSSSRACRGSWSGRAPTPSPSRRRSAPSSRTCTPTSPCSTWPRSTTEWRSRWARNG